MYLGSVPVEFKLYLSSEGIKTFLGMCGKLGKHIQEDILGLPKL